MRAELDLRKRSQGKPEVPAPEFERGLREKTFLTAVPAAASTYIEERVSLLRKTLDQTNALARDGQLPDVELTSSLNISPLEKQHAEGSRRTP